MHDSQSKPLDWRIKNFGELSPREIHGMLKLRVDVFVVEQACAYPEIDGKDPECIHIIGLEGSEVIAVARIAPAGVIYPDASIGRVAVAKNRRNHNYGRIMMEKAIAYCLDVMHAGSIKIAAQCYLEKFYSDLGFRQISETYLWDGIEHIDMRLEQRKGTIY